ADRVFVAIEAGALVRTFDGGRTWRDRVRGGPYDTHTAVTHPLAKNPNNLIMNIERVYGSTWRACILGFAQPSCGDSRVRLAIISRTNAPEVADRRVVEPVVTRCHDGTVAVWTAGYTLSPAHPHPECIEVPWRHIKGLRAEILIRTVASVP